MRAVALTVATEQAPADPTRASLNELLGLRTLAPRAVARAGARRGAPGQHLSHAHARGVDYAESRMYQPGDDIRAMDWRVTARTGKPHTKLFREERERALFLLLDTGATMRFGTRVRFKSAQALRVAALAAWMAVRVGDRVGAVAFGDVRDSVSPRGGARNVPRLLGALLQWDAVAAQRNMGEAESLHQGLERCLRLVHGGSRVLLLSDGFSAGDAARAPLLRLRQRAEVLCMAIHDPLEATPPRAGRFAFAANGKRFRVDFGSDAERTRLASVLGHGQQQLQTLCRTCAVAIRPIDTRAAPAVPLAELFHAGRPASP